MPIGRGSLRLILPGYAPGVTTTAHATPAPALARLLARAAWSADARSSTQRLLAAFGLAPDTSLAAILGCAEFDRRETGWLRADPVHFRADAKLVMLFAPEADELAVDEADALLETLRERMPEFTWQRGGETRRWYARMPGLETTPALGPAWLHGRSLTPFFPHDAAHRRWRQVMTETQMVMHGAPVNVAREARGATPMNALWIWGAGAPPAPNGAALSLAVGGDLLLHGATTLASTPWLARADESALAAALARGDVLVQAGAPFGVRGGAAASVIDDANVLALLAWSLLMRGDAAVIELIGEYVHGFVTRGARWRFWQHAAPGALGDPHAVTP